MRKLVRAIDTYGDNADHEVTSNLDVADYVQGQQPPTKGVPSQPVDDA